MKKLVLVVLSALISSVDAAEVDDKNCKYQLVLENPINTLLGEAREYALCKYDNSGWINWGQDSKVVVRFSGKYKEAVGGNFIFKVHELAPLNGFKHQRHMELVSGFMKCQVFVPCRPKKDCLLHDKDL